MNLLTALNPVHYLSQLVILLIGCFILAAGITLEVKANIAMMSGEYFVRVLSKRLHKEFGFVKLGFDVSLVCIACLLSVIFMSGIYGVREGTVIAALVVGPIVHFLSPYYRIFDDWISDNRQSDETLQPHAPADNVIITIAREFGSGGHLLGEMLAKELGIKVYDKEFIHLAAEASGMDENYIRQNEQSIPSYWLKCIVGEGASEQSLTRSLSSDDILFVAESRIIQRLAEKESCIIIGRCADFVLRDNPNLIKVFCYCDHDTARRRCIEEYAVQPDTADAEIRRINHNRIAHYEYYTGEKWGDPDHYNLMINTGSINLQTACDLIAKLYRSRLKQTKA